MSEEEAETKGAQKRSRPQTNHKRKKTRGKEGTRGQIVELKEEGAGEVGGKRGGQNSGEWLCDITLRYLSVLVGTMRYCIRRVPDLCRRRRRYRCAASPCPATVGYGGGKCSLEHCCSATYGIARRS